MPKGHLSELIHTNRRGYDGLSYEVILTPSQDEKQNRKESEEKKRVCMSCGRVFPDVSLSLSSSSRCRARRNILYVVDNVNCPSIDIGPFERIRALTESLEGTSHK